jgi:hypothetical protein
MAAENANDCGFHFVVRTTAGGFGSHNFSKGIALILET